MKIAVSQIAWGGDDLEGFLRVARGAGAEGVELAPGLLWPEPLDAPAEERRRVRRLAERAGVEIVGFHGLLFHRKDLVLFGAPEARAATAEYLAGLMRLADDVGGRTLVLGSPTHRRRGDLSEAAAAEAAVPALRRAAEGGRGRDVHLLIEPLGADECDFVTTGRAGLDLVRRVAHPNFRLHLDAKALLFSGEDLEALVRDARDVLEHFHAQDPGLEPPGSTGVDHRPIGAALRRAGYDKWVSLEMRRGAEPPEVAIPRAVAYARACYAELKP